MRFVVENLEDSERPYAPWTDKTGLADEFPFATAFICAGGPPENVQGVLQ